MNVTCVGSEVSGAPESSQKVLPERWDTSRKAVDGIIATELDYRPGTRSRVRLEFERDDYWLVVEWPEQLAEPQVAGVIDGAPGVSGKVDRKLALAVWKSVERMKILVRDIPYRGCLDAARSGEALGDFIRSQRRWMKTRPGYSEELSCFPRPWLSELECSATLKRNYRKPSEEESEDVAIGVTARFLPTGAWKEGGPVECYLAG